MDIRVQQGNLIIHSLIHSLILLFNKHCLPNYSVPHTMSGVKNTRKTKDTVPALKVFTV